MTPSAKRRNAWRRGLNAESLSVVWLRILGYQIIERRLRTPVGEIDILARRRDVLAVVEVKTRRTRRSALESVTARQRMRLQRAAQWLIAGRPGLAALTIRFDVIAIAPWRMPVRIIDAWRPEHD
jgi:putative endonuclease